MRNFYYSECLFFSFLVHASTHHLFMFYQNSVARVLYFTYWRGNNEYGSWPLILNTKFPEIVRIQKWSRPNSSPGQRTQKNTMLIIKLSPGSLLDMPLLKGMFRPIFHLPHDLKVELNLPASQWFYWILGLHELI